MEVGEDFQEFWINYPRREAKKEAEWAYEKARLSTSRSEILSGAMRYSAAREHEDPQFTKLAATWLNKHCWTDEIAVRPQKKGLIEMVFEALNLEPEIAPDTAFDQKPMKEFDATPTGIEIVDKAFGNEPQIRGMYKTISDGAKDA